jgi:hypothetical protein
MSSDNTPWYRQFWPWFLLALPASAVVGGIVTLTIAVRTSDGMVVDDYYKEGLAINQQLKRDRLAEQLGLNALVRFYSESNRLEVQLTGTPQETDGPLQVRLIHPTRGEQDRVIPLEALGEGRYAVELEPVLLSHWHVILEPGDRSWRLVGRMRLPEQSQVLLSPSV